MKHWKSTKDKIVYISLWMDVLNARGLDMVIESLGISFEEYLLRLEDEIYL